MWQWHEGVAPSWLGIELGHFQISPSKQAPSRTPIPHPGSHLFSAIHLAGRKALPLRGHTPAIERERSNVVVLTWGQLCPPFPRSLAHGEGAPV